MRHVSRTHRVALDWLFDGFNLEPKIAGILTKGRFWRDEWNHLLCLFNIMSFSTHSGSHLKSSFSQTRRRFVIGAMSKRGQDTTSSDGSPIERMSRHKDRDLQSI